MSEPLDLDWLMKAYNCESPDITQIDPRVDVPRLVARVREVEAALVAARAEIDRWNSGTGVLAALTAVDGVNTLVLTACPAGESCEFVKYALEEAQEQGKPSTVIGVNDE